MAKFGTWTKIEPGCEMPEYGDEVLILLSYTAASEKEVREIELGEYSFYYPNLHTPYPELDGFDVDISWAGNADIKVIAWMPKPPTEMEE